MKNLLIQYLKSIYRSIKIFGLDPMAIINLRHYFKFRKSKIKFLKQGGVIDKNFMILSDYSKKAGINKGHYFHQDLLVASLIFKNNPKRHIDVGSRIDGFVSAVASFRKIEVIDIRPLKRSEHRNIKFIQADCMSSIAVGKTDSLSSLHAIEHFGLGRYDDPIEINGHQKGILNLIKLLKPQGRLYISFPIGQKDEVYFNAHRVFHPKSIFTFENVYKNLKLIRFDYIDDLGDLNLNANINNIKKIKFGCGIYTFLKL